jgi:hypothetical protein
MARVLSFSHTKPDLRAVITGKNSSFNDIRDLKATTLGISRYGRQVGCIVTVPLFLTLLQWQSNNGLRHGSSARVANRPIEVPRLWHRSDYFSELVPHMRPQ